jgi:hypothetical protein
MVVSFGLSAFLLSASICFPSGPPPISHYLSEIHKNLKTDGDTVTMKKDAFVAFVDFATERLRYKRPTIDVFGLLLGASLLLNGLLFRKVALLADLRNKETMNS